MTIDGFCDHTAVNADEEIHQHNAELLSAIDMILYGRITYQLMIFWKEVAENPTGRKFIDDFAVIMDKTPKLVFSHTIKEISWNGAKLATLPLQEEISKLKQQTGNDILIGSSSLIVQSINLNLVDEFQLCVHPVISKTGFSLFKNIKTRNEFILIKIKNFTCGAVILYYQPKNN